eukprot:CAMPEP_0182446092 /NCGR_PEP_ID=MMETSP1172-20130603/3982_1 /TAXON_ID=708627 /ORGANISM="Timspurckia oligopyrenoides, Strain CCMP3278" /LENGTH=394 /DNA_ID=CAMNT_0024641973 /DNA_START=17 /DNA_END=1201 /DNA_ORIENTATION=+
MYIIVILVLNHFVLCLDSDDLTTCTLSSSEDGECLNPSQSSVAVLKQESLTISDITETFMEWKNSQKSNTPRILKETSLAFITPWNPIGNEYALELGKQGKLDVVSPVMYELQPSGDIYGGELYSDEQFKRWKEAGLHVMPRLLVAAGSFWDSIALNKLFLDEIEVWVKPIASELQKRNADGVVLEIITAYSYAEEQLKSLKDPTAGARIDTRYLFKFCMKFADSLRDSYGLKSALVMTPIVDERTAVSLSEVGKHFDFLILMAYEAARQKPLSPFLWLHSLMNAWRKGTRMSQILLGVGFYGREFDGSKLIRAVTANDILEAIESESDKTNLVVVWDNTQKSHRIEWKNSQRQIYFSTPASFAQQIALVEKFGFAGISIWELGQGFPALFDQL